MPSRKNLYHLSTNAVSVARSLSGLEHGFPWTVTFFSAYTTADGSVELLKSNSSELAGFAAITTPAIVIPAEILALRW